MKHLPFLDPVVFSVQACSSFSPGFPMEFPKRLLLANQFPALPRELVKVFALYAALNRGTRSSCPSTQPWEASAAVFRSREDWKWLGCAVTDYTPATYQRSHLERPCKDISS